MEEEVIIFLDLLKEELLVPTTRLTMDFYELLKEYTWKEGNEPDENSI